MDTPPPRIATLVVVDARGTVLGATRPFPVATPWWMDAAAVVEAARTHTGLDFTVLRLLRAELPVAHGGEVTYLAEVDPHTARPGEVLLPCDETLLDDPRRAPYARPGGPARDLAWAEERLGAHAIRRTGAARQQRTWNLSSVWVMPTTAGDVWLKAVPPFFAHEGPLVAALAAARHDTTLPLLPHVLASDGARTLFAHIDGSDRYDAPFDERTAMIDALVALQAAWSAHVDVLLGLGLPDWRASPLVGALTALVRRRAHELGPDDARVLERFVNDLDARLARVDACAIPETLLHGDFHPGNVRATDGGAPVLLDWGDAGVAHPLLDVPAFERTCPEAERAALLAHWTAAWQRAAPGSDPATAMRLLRPVAAARQALVYQRFLDGIEATEHPYHAADVPHWLHATARALRADAPTPTV